MKCDCKPFWSKFNHDSIQLRCLFLAGCIPISFYHGVYKRCNEPETSGDWLTNIIRRHFCSFPFFSPLFTFSYRNFFPSFVCFDILWQLSTTHARSNTRDKNANTVVRTKITSLDIRFFKGNKSSSRSLALSLAFAAENIKILPLALRAGEKIWNRQV